MCIRDRLSPIFVRQGGRRPDQRYISNHLGEIAILRAGCGNFDGASTFALVSAFQMERERADQANIWIRGMVVRKSLRPHVCLHLLAICLSDNIGYCLDCVVCRSCWCRLDAGETIWFELSELFSPRHINFHSWLYATTNSISPCVDLSSFCSLLVMSLG